MTITFTADTVRLGVTTRITARCFQGHGLRARRW